MGTLSVTYAMELEEYVKAITAVEEEETIVVDYTNSEVEAIINDRIHSERDRKILKRRLIDGITFERIAEEFDMSTRQIKNIVYKSEKKIFL